jgi:hypothetical protein
MTVGLRVTFQNLCGRMHDKNFALRKLLHCFSVLV